MVCLQINCEFMTGVVKMFRYQNIDLDFCDLCRHRGTNLRVITRITRKFL